VQEARQRNKDCQNTDPGYVNLTAKDNMPSEGSVLYESLAKSVEKQQRLNKFLKTREDDTSYAIADLQKKTEEKMKFA